MIACAIAEDRFNEIKCRLFIEYISNVKDWSKLELAEDQTFTDLIGSLRHVA